MSEPALDIADDLVTGINAHSWSLNPLASRAYIWRENGLELNQLRVLLFPWTINEATGSRESRENDSRTWFFVAEKLADRSDAVIDARINFCHELRTWLADRELPGAESLRFETDALFEYEPLNKNGLFLQMFALVWRADA